MGEKKFLCLLQLASLVMGVGNTIRLKNKEICEGEHRSISPQGT